MPVGVLVSVSIGVGVTVLVEVGVRVGVLVGAGPHTSVMRKPQPLRVPSSPGARSLMVRVHVPTGYCPSNADKGLPGRNKSLAFGGHTEPMAAAASSSSVMLLTF